MSAATVARAAGGASVLEELRRRPDPDDPFDQTAGRREYRRAASRKDRSDRSAAELGRRTGRDEERARSRKRPSAGRKRSTRRPSTRRAARQMARPLQRQVSSGMQVLGLTFAVLALYLVLENAGHVEGALGGLARGLEWLRRPDRSIPYAR